MSTATSTQTSSTECPSTESSTIAADPVLTREEAIAILAGPDSELPELVKRAGALCSGTRGLFQRTRGGSFTRRRLHLRIRLPDGRRTGHQRYNSGDRKCRIYL